MNDSAETKRQRHTTLQTYANAMKIVALTNDVKRMKEENRAAETEEESTKRTHRWYSFMSQIYDL